MANSINLSLTKELRRFIDERASDEDIYSTPSEYIRDLIRQDMQNQLIVRHITRGLDDIRHSRFSGKSIIEVGKED